MVMKILWFIDVKYIKADELTSKLQHFNKIHTFFENKNNLTFFNKEFQPLSQKFQYLMMRDFFEGEKVKILLKYKENPNDMAKVVVLLKESRLMEFKNQIYWQKFNRYLKEILGMKLI